MKEKKKKMLLGLIVLFFAVALILTIYSPNPFWSALVHKINSGQTSIPISELTDFEWDTLCVLEPYSLGSDNIREQKISEFIPADLGAFKNKIPDINDDGLWAFVFINKGSVVAIEKRGRGYYLYKDYQRNCIEKSAALLRNQGKKIYITDKQGEH